MSCHVTALVMDWYTVLLIIMSYKMEYTNNILFSITLQYFYITHRYYTYIITHRRIVIQKCLVTQFRYSLSENYLNKIFTTFVAYSSICGIRLTFWILPSGVTSTWHAAAGSDICMLTRLLVPVDSNQWFTVQDSHVRRHRHGVVSILTACKLCKYYFKNI